MKKNNISERQLREYIRKYIKRTLNEADDNDAEGDEGNEEAPKDAKEKQAPKQEKPVKKAEPEEKPEEDTTKEKLQKVTGEYTRKLKEMGGKDYLSTILSDVIQSFGMTTEEKLSLIRNVKAEIIK